MQVSKEPNQALLLKLRGGDLAAFEELCLDIEKPLLGYLAGFVGPMEAEDLGQETFLRFYQLISNGKLASGQQSFRSLLFSIAHNLAMDFFRKAKRSAPMAPSPARSPERQMEVQLLKAEVAKALAVLPQEHREALVLREYGELSYAEIAELLGMDVTNVKVWIYRARKRLARCMDQDGQFIGNGLGGSSHGD